MSETQPTNRKPWAVFVIVMAVIGLGGLLTLPFFFESQTMNYKFGWDKIMLRAGKMVGLAAAFLLMLQLILAGRLKWLDRLYSLPGLYRFHRINAYCLGALVLLHPMLVLLPDDMLIMPLEGRYWPEWVGAALFLVIAVQVGISRWRRLFFKAYQKWRLAHRILGTTALILIVVHVRFVSETFEQAGLPRYLLDASAFLLTCVLLWLLLRAFRSRKNRYRLTRIEPAGQDAYTLEMAPLEAPAIRYLPGQFAFLSLRSEHLSSEFHPFTLSSTPSRPENVQFTIRCCGDWTDQIGMFKRGEVAQLEGAFGHFSYLLLPPDQEILFIAGGIGITPMLSMLRHMVDTKVQRPVTLLWSNTTQARLFGADELNAMTKQLTAFRWIPIFSREKSSDGHSGRLDRDMLASLLKNQRRDTAVFMCGPPQMTQQVGKHLQQLGFASRSIYTEAFGL